MFTSRNNRFVHNTYYLGSPTLAANAFDWMDKTIGPSAWQEYGQDTTGTFNYSAMSAMPAASLVAAPSGTDNIAAEASVSFGTSVSLTWSSSSTSSCAGTGFSTGGAIAGSVTVTSSNSITYRVDCTGPGGSASAQTRVIVAANTIPVANLTIYPATIGSGGSAALSWSSTNAASCLGSGFNTNNATSGSVPVTPPTSTTYSVTCTGPGVSASGNATVTVSNVTFQIGISVHTTVGAAVLNRPTLNGSIVCTDPPGALGVITQGPSNHSGYTWWHVNFNTGCSGWVAQNNLTVGTP